MKGSGFEIVTHNATATVLTNKKRGQIRISFQRANLCSPIVFIVMNEERPTASRRPNKAPARLEDQGASPSFAELIQSKDGIF